MLYTNTVAERTLDLLKGLMSVPELDSFILVGGTALSLQIGHRISVDIDLFSNTEIDLSTISQLVKGLGTVKMMTQSKNVLILNINDVKVDFVNYSYPFIFDHKIIANIRFADVRDIAAMKLAAVSGRGRKRDFFDIYFLLKDFTLQDILGFYKDKFSDGSVMQVLRSLTYFEDAETDTDPFLVTQCSWSQIKNEITEKVREFSC